MGKDLHTRLNAVFGGLCPSEKGSEKNLWYPERHTVFRAGREEVVDDSEEKDALMEEKARRRGVSSSVIEETEVEMMSSEEGMRPSYRFCQSVDTEAETTHADLVATLMLEDDPRPAACTEVLDGNVYDMRLGVRDMERNEYALPESIREGDKQGEEDQLQPSPGRGHDAHLDALAERGFAVGSHAGIPNKSSFRRKKAGENLKKKRVSFEGLPDIPKPYVPPHKREGFAPMVVDVCPKDDDLIVEVEKNRSLDMKYNKISSDEAKAVEGDRTEKPEYHGHTHHDSESRSKKHAPSVPDHVRHPDRYTCYELGESIVVGGGVNQLFDESMSMKANYSCICSDDMKSSEATVNKMNENNSDGKLPNASLRELEAPTYVPKRGLFSNSTREKTTRQGQISPSFLGTEVE